MIVVLCGKAASGKDSILESLCRDKRFSKMISFTTRPKRPCEEEGREYFFTDNQHFEKMLDADEMIECRRYFPSKDMDPSGSGWYYGLHKTKNNYETGRKGVVIVDLDGAESLIRHFGKENTKVFYIDASDEERRRRSSSRGGMSDAEWNRRLMSDKEKFSEARIRKLNAVRVKNEGEINDAVNEIKNKIGG